MTGVNNKPEGIACKRWTRFCSQNGNDFHPKTQQCGFSFPSADGVHNSTKSLPLELQRFSAEKVEKTREGQRSTQRLFLREARRRNLRSIGCCFVFKILILLRTPTITYPVFISLRTLLGCFAKTINPEERQEE